jgi:Glycosyl transferase family 2
MLVATNHKSVVVNLCARNADALAATGQYLAFVDQDDEVGDGWLSAMGAALSRYDFVGCAIDFQKLNERGLQKTRVGGQSHTMISPAYPHRRVLPPSYSEQISLRMTAYCSSSASRQALTSSMIIRFTPSLLWRSCENCSISLTELNRLMS